MRNIKTPSSLKWLITKKARISGEINSIEKLIPIWELYTRPHLEVAERKIALLREDHKKSLLLEKKLPKLKIQLEAIEIALSLHDIQINTELIGPQKTSKQKTFGPYGCVTRYIYECLRSKKGPATSKEITLYVLVKSNIDVNSVDIVEMRKAVTKRLRTLVHQGKIERMHQLVGAEEGIWKIPSSTLIR